MIISQDALQRLSTIWAGEAGREPNADDVRGLLAEYVREEVLYREAKRLGLDKDDTIIRRRLAQKMGFLLSNETDLVTLSDADLRESYDADREIYRRPAQITFVHVPFNFAPDGSSRTEEIEASAILLREDGGAAWETLGDPFMLSRSMSNIDETALARLFGREFAARVFELPVGDWSLPIRSRLANHLVRVEAREEGGIPTFETVIADVRKREMERRKRERDAAALEDVMQRYQVIIDDRAPS